MRWCVVLPEATDIGALLDPVKQNRSIASTTDHEIKRSREGQARDWCLMAEQNVHAAEELEEVVCNVMLVARPTG